MVNGWGADINKYVVAMLNALSNGWVPPETISRETYNDYRQRYYNNESKDDFLIGYIGVNGSYNGRFYDGGYAGTVTTKIGTFRDYTNEAYSNVVKQTEGLRGVVFKHSSYKDLDLPENSLIYCDPPYYGTKEYRESKINHDHFWQWCRDKTLEGHTVFISEYSAPEDFECVWEKKVNSSMTQDTGAKKATEKLFKWRG